MEKKVKIAIIGGGASGLSAAVAAGRKFGKGCAVILEKQNRCGRKLLATGNGRCNITNTSVSSIHYFGDNQIIDSVIDSFSGDDCIRFLEKNGLLLKMDNNSTRVYPYSNRSDTVLECIKKELQHLSINTFCDSNILSVRQHDQGYTITTDDITVYAENVVLAAGAKATPSLGSDDSGFALLDSLGIGHTPLFPALCPVKVKENYPSLKGVRSAGCVSLICDGKTTASEYGEIQFAEKYLSGICVFNISGFVNDFFTNGSINGNHYNSIKISLDLLPEHDIRELHEYLKKCRRLFSDEGCDMLLSGALNKKCSSAVMKFSGFKNITCGEISDKDLKTIAYSAKNFVFTPEKEMDFKNAQVCGGGVGSACVDPQSLMSRKYKGLYICGEMLDCYGLCGGFNLHFAIGSAVKAVNNIN